MQEIGRILKGKTTVLLDLDGTLVDSVHAHAVSWKKVLSRHGHEVDVSSLERLIGMGGDKMLRSAIGEVSEAEEKALTEERSARFRENEIRDARPFERAKELIQALRENGLTVMLATAASADDRDALLKQGGLQDAFEEFVSSDEVDGSKPEPDLIETILEKLDVAPADCILVGDSPFDAEAASRAGVDFVGVETGAYSSDELPYAVAVFSSVDEFARMLTRRIVWT
jgi:HAD superfamily hydrolase (TIGR01509 family)